VLTKIKDLGRNLAVYGFGDVVTSVLSFLLLPVYVRYLSPADYGVISLLLTIEVVSKIVFRWGVDASFMRLYYDCEDEGARQRLASTILFFLLGVNGVFLLAAMFAAPAIARHLFGSAEYATLLRLVLVNTFIVGFYFIPFHVLRINRQSPQFIALTFTRSAATLAARLWLVVGAGLGVTGVVLADVLVTAGFTLLLARWFTPLIRPMFSGAMLRDALAFGLPRIPHGIAHQIVGVADRYLLSRFVAVGEIGLYSMGASFGLTLKLFLSAFEYAWAPFYFATMREPDAKETFSGITTYGFAVLALLVAGLSAVAPDLIRLMLVPEFYGASAIVPWIALGVLLQGVYLLTSIGLNITKNTRYYPVATGIAAAASVGANLLLIPRFGALGSAWAYAFAYAVLAGVSMRLSQRVYPIRYEWGRLFRVTNAGLAAYLVPIFLVPESLPPLAGVLLRGTLVVVTFALMLAATGFADPRERRTLARLRRLWMTRKAAASQAVPESIEGAGEIVAAVGADDDATELGRTR